ncbi:hypothetical protein [Sphingomonas elodea]|uniref:hypothetical protein n=1 Tax=Sphingomonas elodea TaxID=179878 RepID=UPI00026319EF|nr:hypothetical protein [Sphingomonas elodea]
MESVARLLQQRWPGSTLLTPADVGLGRDKDSIATFLAMVESLSDSGFLSYEALVFNAEGPMVIDAALTARGRAMLAAEGDLAH